MPFNGSNVYSPPGADFPAVTNTLISSTHFNNVINDIATALSDCVTRDGQGALTANLNMGGFKVTNLAAGSVGAPGLYMSSDTSTGIYRSAANEIAFTISGTQRGRFDSTGLIVTGVGTFSGAISGTVLTGSTSVITPIIDSGTTGSLLLKTNNGTSILRLDHIASGVNFLAGVAAATTGRPVFAVQGSDTNIGLLISSSGTGAIDFFTGGSNTTPAVGAIQQLSILHTAGSTRWITVTGSNGGNPTISTTAGSLAITPAIVAASTIVASSTITATAFILSGTVAGTGVVRLANATAINYRNSGDTGDLTLIDSATVNSIADVVRVGPSLLASGVILHGRSGGAAPNTTDLPTGMFTVWRDTAGATTKLYYNNAGAIQSVALA